MRIAALQLASIGMSTTKLYHYIRIAHKKGVKLLLLSEYMLNSFFKELESTPISMIDKLSTHQISTLKQLSLKYDMSIVAPLVVVRDSKPYKMVVKISPRSIHYYQQQVLIDYSHWSEQRYFANPSEPLRSMPTFRLDGICFGILSGFELHFDQLWRDVHTKRIDCVLLPTASTFESDKRWRSLISSRSFTHNCYILRANRIGRSSQGEHEWKFYGDSLLCNPDGTIEEHLDDSEQILVCDIEHSTVVEARKRWKFKEIVQRRGLEDLV